MKQIFVSEDFQEDLLEVPRECLVSEDLQENPQERIRKTTACMNSQCHAQMRALKIKIWHLRREVIVRDQLSCAYVVCLSPLTFFAVFVYVLLLCWHALNHSNLFVLIIASANFDMMRSVLISLTKTLA